MATILDIAERADVPVEAVLRVVNGDPVSEAYAERVKSAMDVLRDPGGHRGVVSLRREPWNVWRSGGKATHARVEPAALEHPQHIR